ncbi:hypothetical protein ACG33_01875 [Steroidobacter denitrificans]|uniref:Uncharacterized protein n=1 Tax=Steroidobacter denitrificans TaxID=465721 RepID=A0A127F610_STEDE|nr:hypothetical protein [Steroidobacter denitrificans]AMN45876.1 hypothetical protein ACG33_01875 [Steroidobacter denitrificans]
MKKRIVLGAGLVLTLGTAVASMYGRGETDSVLNLEMQTDASSEVSAATLALWKATAASRDYTAPKLPI